MCTKLFKATTCDDTTLCYSILRHTITKIDQNANWLSADAQTRIDPIPIQLINVEPKEELASNTIKVKMRRNPAMDTSETYNINMYKFEVYQPEEFLALLKNFRVAIDGTGTTSPPGQMIYLHNMVLGRL